MSTIPRAILIQSFASVHPLVLVISKPLEDLPKLSNVIYRQPGEA